MSRLLVVGVERFLQRFAHAVAGLLAGERGFDGATGQAVVAVFGAFGEQFDDRDHRFVNLDRVA